jgi:hypothetical protein
MRCSPHRAQHALRRINLTHHQTMVLQMAAFRRGSRVHGAQAWESKGKDGFDKAGKGKAMSAKEPTDESLEAFMQRVRLGKYDAPEEPRRGFPIPTGLGGTQATVELFLEEQPGQSTYVNDSQKPTWTCGLSSPIDCSR